MKWISKDEVLDGFYEEIKEDFPYSKEQVQDAVKCFFNYIKVSMKDPELPEIRVKYFGHFYVVPGKVQSTLKKTLKTFFKCSGPHYADRLKEKIDLFTNYLQKHAPEKLTLPKSFFKGPEGKTYTEEYILLPSGEYEVQTLLHEEPLSEETTEETHTPTNQFPDFFHGLSML